MIHPASKLCSYVLSSPSPLSTPCHFLTFTHSSHFPDEPGLPNPAALNLGTTGAAEDPALLQPGSVVDVQSTFSITYHAPDFPFFTVNSSKVALSPCVVHADYKSHANRGQKSTESCKPCITALPVIMLITCLRTKAAASFPVLPPCAPATL